jgi:putative ABC transport system substrate-binding protein
MAINIGRRKFVIALGGAAAAWPLAARGQTAPLPVIGYLAQGTPEATTALVAAVRQGLGEAGLVEGKDFTSEFRWAGNDGDRLPELATDLVRHRVAVIIALDTVTAARAAKAATTEIPILFTVGADPVQAGLVTSLNHPGGNVSGISTMSTEIAPKWVGLLHELLPAARRVAVLVNIVGAETARSLITGAQGAALTMGMQTEIVFASSDREIDAALADLGARSQALMIQPDALFLQNREKLAALAIREKLPAISTVPDFAKAGGLMSYGSSFVDAHRQAGVYAGRILKGEKVGDLPVQRATKFELVINLKTAKAIGLDIPAMFLARADAVIE